MPPFICWSSVDSSSSSRVTSALHQSISHSEWTRRSTSQCRKATVCFTFVSLLRHNFLSSPTQFALFSVSLLSQVHQHEFESGRIVADDFFKWLQPRFATLSTTAIVYHQLNAATTFYRFWVWSRLFRLFEWMRFSGSTALSPRVLFPLCQRCLQQTKTLPHLSRSRAGRLLWTPQLGHQTGTGWRSSFRSTIQLVLFGRKWLVAVRWRAQSRNWIGFQTRIQAFGFDDCRSNLYDWPGADDSISKTRSTTTAKDSTNRAYTFDHHQRNCRHQMQADQSGRQSVVDRMRRRTNARTSRRNAGFDHFLSISFLHSFLAQDLLISFQKNYNCVRLYHANCVLCSHLLIFYLDYFHHSAFLSFYA